MNSFPSLFLAHGAPDLPLSTHPAKRFLSQLGAWSPRPRAILAISAHWEAPGLALGTAAAPRTVHDFGGWPAALYQLDYPARNDLALVARIRSLLDQAGLPVAEQPAQGYDHGVWVPLLLIYPDADIPVVQLSLQRGGTAAEHFAIGGALAALRAEGVLIVGSGATVHNLGEVAAEGTPPPDWAQRFDLWLSDSLARRDLPGLLRFPDAPAMARRAHPTSEHFLPFFVALGAGWEGGQARCLHQSYSYGSIGMACYAFGGGAEIDPMAPASEIAG
jgi:4,5-DOPA dioxygenase extradiol|tara:strand:+ start:1646 stop:2470 length:825 start_codon:yes stop_codon:yes gene_type:complete